MPNTIRMLVLDVLKPHQPSIIHYAQKLATLEGVDGVNISVIEVDTKTETVKISMEGSNIHFEQLTEAIAELGGTIHSIDKVGAGQKSIKEIPTSERSRE